MSTGNININILANNEGLKKGLVEASATVQTEGKKMAESATRASDAITKGMNGAGKGTESLRTQMRQATQDAQRMANAYGETSKEFITAATEAARLRDQFGDINNVINALQPDAPFKAMSGIIQGAAGGLSAVTGLMGLLGDESQATQEMILKVQSALALSQGVDAVMGLKDAFTALNVVILANPIVAGAVAIAVAAAAVAYVAYSSSITDAERAQTTLNQVQTEGLKNAQAELVHLNNLVAIAKDDATARSIRQAAIDELNKTYPSLLNNLTLENINTQGAAKAIDAQTEAIKRRAMTRAAEKKLEELASKKLELENNGPGFLNKAKAVVLATGGFAGYDESLAQMQKNDLATINAEMDKLTGYIKANADAYVDLDASAKKAEETAKKVAEELAKANKEPAKKAAAASQGTGWQQEVITAPMRGVGSPVGDPVQIRTFATELSTLQESLPKYATDVRQVTFAWQEHAAAIQQNIGLNQLAADSISMVANTIGSALAGAHVTMANILEGILGIMANFMKSLGESMIAAGTAGLAAKLLLVSPGAAIAAGVALVALASIVSAKLSSGPGGSHGGGGGSSSMGVNKWSMGTMNLGYKGPNGQGKSGNANELTLSAVLHNDKIIMGNKAAMRKLGRQGLVK